MSILTFHYLKNEIYAIVISITMCTELQVAILNNTDREPYKDSKYLLGNAIDIIFPSDFVQNFQTPLNLCYNRLGVLEIHPERQFLGKRLAFRSKRYIASLIQFSPLHSRIITNGGIDHCLN